jgi:EAL domain-containing protein (putative c-di-GMP-specific phosphodiesterase class I)
MSKTDIICRTSVNFNNNQLSQAELVNIFNNLLDRTGLAAANINITGNYGAAALTVPERAIATLKNWTITG